MPLDRPMIGGGAQSGGAQSGGPDAGADRAEQVESTAHGIYGLVVSGSVLATSVATSAGVVIVEAVLTLFVYWLAERYAWLIAERTHARHRLTVGATLRRLVRGSALIATSAFPLAVLAAVRLRGADVDMAVQTALICSALLLTRAGWRIGQDGRLSTRERCVSALLSGLLGAGMVALKAFLH